MPSRTKVAIEVMIGTPPKNLAPSFVPVKMQLDRTFDTSAEASRATSLFLAAAIGLACQWDAAALNTPTEGADTDARK